MKKTKRILPLLMATLLCGALATPLFSCGGSGGDNSPTEKTGKANVISSSLLDGKIANLMSANGIAIQDKTQTTQPTQATPLSTKGIFFRQFFSIYFHAFYLQCRGNKKRGFVLCDIAKNKGVRSCRYVPIIGIRYCICV